MEQVKQAEALFYVLASIKHDIADLKKDVKGKTPTLSTEEAVEGFRAYLEDNAKPNTQRSFNYLLREFEVRFAGCNVPEVSALHLQEFLAARWGARKKTVLKQTLSKLKWFYNWCSKYVQMRGMPPFSNPCDLIEVKEEAPPKRPEFIPTEKMAEFLATMKDERHWLVSGILLTAGLRVSELIGDPRGGKLGLLRQDVDGRVLTIREPKSGRGEELAVIPDWVSKRLESYMEHMGPGDRVFPVSYSTVRDVISTHGKWVGLELAPHALRKWCATFWNRQREYTMTSFVMRHANIKGGDTTLVTNLGARYVAPLSPGEVMKKQDKLMKRKLFEVMMPCRQ